MKLLLLLIMLNIMAFGQSPENLLDTIIDIMNPENSQAVMTQTIMTSSGQTRTFVFDTFSGNKGENTIMRYKSPSRVKGNAMLTKNYSDDIWMYNRRTNRVRKLASHAKKQKFEGSDFTYEDMGTGESWKTDFNPAIIGEDTHELGKCTLLELTSVQEDATYSKLVLWVRQKDNYPVQVDYYDKNGDFVKTLYLQNITPIEGILTAMKMVMKNHLDQTYTTMEYQDITYDVSFDNRFFSDRNLKK